MQKYKDMSPAQLRQTLMFDVIQGYAKTQVVSVFARLGIADLLKDGERTVAELSEPLQIDAERLHRFMRVAEVVGLCEHVGQEQYCLTDLGRPLISDSRGSLREAAISTGRERYQLWGDLLYSIQTGKDAFTRVFGKDFFEYKEQKKQTDVFHDDLASTARSSARDILSSCTFDSISCVVDVGGGYGALISEILNAHPHLTGILFDREATLAGATQHLETSGITARCRPVAGDFFESVPAGGDMYIVSKVIHNWNDENALSILRNCCRAMGKHGKLVIIDHVMPENTDGPFPIIWTDLFMLLLTGGQVRTVAQYQSLLEAADLQLLRVVPTSPVVAIIEAAPRFA